MIEHEKGAGIAETLRNIIKKYNFNEEDFSHKAINELMNRFEDIEKLSKRHINHVRHIIIRAKLFRYFGECMFLFFSCF